MRDEVEVGVGRVESRVKVQGVGVGASEGGTCVVAPFLREHSLVR